MGKPPDVPDLDLPSGGAPSSRKPSTSTPSGPTRPAASDDDDLFGDGIERGGGFEPPVASRPAPISSRQPPISSRAPASLNLDVAYRRPTRPEPADLEPSFLEKAGGRVLSLVGVAAVVAPLLKLVHHAGAWSVTKLLPHAFDATSLAQSGAVAFVLLVASIAFGYLGIKARPRSWATIGSAFVLLISSLAMVTVALVATDENPSPADGARLIPYSLPFALVLLGLGVSTRGQEPFYDGGAKRLWPLVAGLGGGLLVYAGIALSAF